VEAAVFLAELVPVLPPPAALEAAQDRLTEKHLFQKLGIATTEFAAVADRDALDSAVNKIGLPAILKTCRMVTTARANGFLRTPEDVLQRKMNCRPLIPPREITAAPKVRTKVRPSCWSGWSRSLAS